MINIFQVKVNYPQTPPSLSSELEIQSYNERDQSYSSFRIFTSKIKELAKNRHFLVAVLGFGSFGGSTNVFMTKVKSIPA